MTGKSVLVLSLMSDLWALSSSYSLTSLDSSLAFYINFSSSLYTEDYYAGSKKLSGFVPRASQFLDMRAFQLG